MLFYCWGSALSLGPTLMLYWLNVSCLLGHDIINIIHDISWGGFQQTREIEPMLFECWSTACDGGPTLTQYWVNDSCLLFFFYLLLLVGLVVQMKLKN